LFGEPHKVSIARKLGITLEKPMMTSTNLLVLLVRAVAQMSVIFHLLLSKLINVATVKSRKKSKRR